MKYSVKISEDETFVWQLPHENITMQIAKEMSHDAIKLARPKNINRFLSNVKGMRNVSNIVENYDFAYIGVEKVGYKHSDKIAILHDVDDSSHNFIETASINAGYSVKLFTEMHDAIDWLLK